MILGFRHKRLEAFHRTGVASGIPASHATKLRRILGALEVAICPEDLNFPSFQLHPLRGDRKDYWAISVSGNWRVIFQFIGADVDKVDYLDYH